MSDWDDLEDVTQPRISEEEADRLLTGTASGVDEAHDLADLSAVFQALRRPAEPAELADLPGALAAFGHAVVTMQTDPSTARTRPMIKKLLTGKAIAVIGVVTLASAGAAAAAGVVPTPFSSKPSIAARPTDDSDDAVETTAVETSAVETTAVETSAVATTPTTAAADLTDASKALASTDSTDVSDNQGPDVNGPAKFGLCTAFEARSKHDATGDTTPPESTSSSSTVVISGDANSDQPPPFKALSDAADAAGQSVADFCADAVPGGESSDAPGQPGGNPSATAPGRSNDNPSATAPGKSGGNPSATAPGQSGGNPSDTAPGHSGGAHGKPVSTSP